MKNAKMLGGKYAILFVSIGLMIAILLIILIIPGGENGSLFDGILSILSEYSLTTFVGVFLLYFFGWTYGMKAGEKIIIHKKRPELVGIITGIKLLVSSLLISTLITYCQEGIRVSGFLHGIFDYILNPIFSIMIFAMIPLGILGVLYGKTLKKYT